MPVVIHDTTLDRTGRRAGRIADLTSEQLDSIDVGSWFNDKHPKRAAADFANETVPRLSKVLELMKDFKGLIYIELKPTDGNVPELVRAVCEVILVSPLRPQMIVKSFRLAAIPAIRCQLPDVTTAALFSPDIMTFLKRRKHIVAIAREFGADQISLHRTLVTRRLVSLAADAVMPVTIWTADDPKWVSRCQRLGVGALITNDPAGLIAVKKVRRTLIR